MKKKLALVLVVIIAVGGFSAMAAANAMPFWNWRNFQANHGNLGNGNHGFRYWSNTNLQTSFVRFNGVINEWGTTEVNGTLQAQARTIVINQSDVRQGSSVTAIWTTNNSRPIEALRTRENFTYTFYTAKLVDASESALNVEGNDFVLTGNWTVYEVTANITVITNADGDIVSFHNSQDATALATKASGDLNVTDNWSNFTLNIEGVDQLSGTVHAQRTTTRMFNPFKINDDDSDTVTTTDLASVVHAYGAMPGWGNYDQRMDYNFNYKVDICDLSTAAANVNA